MLSKKFESNTQDPPFASLDMNLVTMESNNEPDKTNPTLVKKSVSEVKVLEAPDKKNDDIVLNLKKELIYKRDLEIKQRFPKGKFIVAYEPSKRQDFYVMRLKECLNIKRRVAWVDFYDLTTKNEDYWEFTKDKEGIVQWDNMIALLNVKVKPKEEVHAVKLLTIGPLLDKINKFMGKKKNKRDRKRLDKQEENKEDSDSDFDDSDSDADTVNLLPGSKKEEAKQIAAPAEKKFFKRIKKTPGQKKALEEKKRKDAENKDRRIHIELEESGIRIVKTRNINDTDKEEIVDVDPTLKEIRPKKWKVVEREEENKEAEIIDEERMRFSTDSNLIYLEDSSTTSNRNIIRACLTDNADLAKLCINEKQLITSLMESWSPEIKSTAIELCITNNSRKVLLLLLDVCKEEEEKVRANPNREHLKKFDTGQVDERAFGTRVRKVEMMRGGRQGNNAFMQDVRRNDEYKTILQQLNEDEILAVRVAYSCNVERETLRLIYEELKDQAAPFFKQLFFHILRTGRRHLAAECLEILKRVGDAETKEQITDEMIEVLQLESEEHI